MIRITSKISLAETELNWDFTHASGPGGQNVNKVATAVRLHFDLINSPSLPDDVRARLSRLAGRKVNSKGILTIDGRRFRTQEKNRRDALHRLIKLIRQAARKPRLRRRTRPSHASVERRLESKRHRGEIKRRRQAPSDSADQ